MIFHVQVKLNQFSASPNRTTNPLTLLVYFSTNTYRLASLIEFRKRSHSPVEFVKNTLAFLVFFAVSIVSNNIGSLGMYTSDGMR